MSRVLLRLVGLAAVIGLFVYGATKQNTSIRSFTSEDLRTLPDMALHEAPGMAPWWPSSFTEGATADAFVLRPDGLYSRFTLSSGQASIKDCKT